MVRGPYWRGVRVALIWEANRWIIDGETALQGVNLLDLDPERFSNAVLTWLHNRRDRTDEEGRQEWDQVMAWVDTPPTVRRRAVAPSRPLPVPVMSAAQQAEAFDAFAAVSDLG